jgi:hypothetical protein
VTTATNLTDTGSVVLQTDKLTISLPIYIRFSESTKAELLRWLACRQVTVIPSSQRNHKATTFVADQATDEGEKARLTEALGASPSFFSDLVRNSVSGLRLPTVLALSRALGIELVTEEQVSRLADEVFDAVSGLCTGDTPSIKNKQD